MSVKICIVKKKAKFYYGLITIRGGQCSSVAKIFLVRGNVILVVGGSVIGIIFITINQMIVYRFVGMQIHGQGLPTKATGCVLPQVKLLTLQIFMHYMYKLL